MPELRYAPQPTTLGSTAWFVGAVVGWKRYCSWFLPLVADAPAGTTRFRRIQFHRVAAGSRQSEGPCITVMALDQLKAFILKMQDNEELKQRVLAASTADDVAKLAMTLGFEFSGDELLRFNGKKVGKVTVVKPDHPGEYH